MSDARRELRLTTDEVALVLRRAAEIEDRDEGDDGTAEGYDLAAVEAAAGEVGLQPDAVRRAVAELRVGSLAPSPPPGAAPLTCVDAF